MRALHPVSVGKTDGRHGPGPEAPLVVGVLEVEVGGLAHVVHDAGPGHGGAGACQMLFQILDVCWPDEVVEPVVLARPLMAPVTMGGQPQGAGGHLAGGGGGGGGSHVCPARQLIHLQLF